MFFLRLKEVLLKAVVMAQPNFSMGCFLLPKTTCQQIEAVIADFWWRGSGEAKGMHWKTWKHLCRPKYEGGLGFKELEAFNLALLGKQVWRMLTKPNTLVAKVFKARYFRKTSILKASLGSRPSYAWRSLHAAHRLINTGARALIGNGDNTNLWEDPWLEDKPARPMLSLRWLPLRNQAQLSRCEKVKDFLLPDKREWNEALVREIVSEEDWRKIEKIRPGGPACQDAYSWDYTPSGHYTVKSGYWIAVNLLKEKTVKETLQPSLDVLF